jgi:metalloendopeptidase OMA1, mitochondrial
MQEAAYAEILQEYKGKILPPNHILHRHIRRVVSRILEANDLGVLKDERTIGPLTNVGIGSRVSSLHDPEGHLAGGGVPQWTLTVVDDTKMINAAASLRKLVNTFILNLPPSKTYIQVIS